MCGMTYDQFWNNGINLFMIYVSAYNRKMKDDYTKLDTLAWNTGLYVLRALQSQPIMAYGMTDPQGIRKCRQDFPKKPMSIEHAEEEKRELELFKEKKKAERPTSEQLEAYKQLIASIPRKEE